MGGAFLIQNNMKIAGVGVNIKCLPTREVLINQALKTAEYKYKRNALELINKEIDNSELFKSTTTKTKEGSKKPTKVNKGGDKEARARDTGNDKE